MVRKKVAKPVHSSSRQRRSRSSSSSSSSSDESRTNANEYASSSSRIQPSTSSSNSMRRSNKRGPAPVIKKKPKKRPANMLFTIRYLPQVLRISKKLFKEMRDLQKSTNTLIPRLPFQRVVREIMQDFWRDRETMRIQVAALEALHQSAEMYLTQLFEDAYFCSLHAKRKTLRPVDIQCVRRIRGIGDIINH